MNRLDYLQQQEELLTELIVENKMEQQNLRNNCADESVEGNNKNLIVMVNKRSVPLAATFAERKLQHAQSMFCENLRFFTEDIRKNGRFYYIKDSQQKTVFIFAGAEIEVLDPEPMVVMAVLEFVVRKQNWDSARVYGSSKFRKHVLKASACKNTPLNIINEEDDINDAGHRIVRNKPLGPSKGLKR